MLFSGTLKDNLDPHGYHSDDKIYDALQHAHLKPFVESLPDKLDYQCGEGGQNLRLVLDYQNEHLIYFINVYNYA